MAQIFVNSECIIVEYLDIIRAPGITCIDLLKNVSKFREDFDCSEIDTLDTKGLEEWYVKRNNVNPFKCLKNNLDDLTLSMTYYSNIDNFDILEASKKLPGLNILKRAISDDLCKKIVFYIPEKMENIIKDIEVIMENISYELIIGDFAEGVSKYNTDSLYLLSDYTKINILKELGRVQLSAIIAPSDYSYNYKDGEVISDMSEMMTNTLFKYMTYTGYPITPPELE